MVMPMIIMASDAAAVNRAAPRTMNFRAMDLNRI